MEWVRDGSGRFSQRPYYEQAEMDFECERLVSTFLLDRHGQVTYPITTSDLTILIEREVADLDLGVDLSNEGDAVEGLTDFFPKSKPKVRISNTLTAPVMENRLRTTLTHELGHVKFHNFLWSFGQLPLITDQAYPQSPRCKRDQILISNKIDWMEWQAGYACGAYLMPISPLRQGVSRFLESAQWEGSIPLASPLAASLIRQVKADFAVSDDAARVRLLKCQFLSGDAPTKRMIQSG